MKSWSRCFSDVTPAYFSANLAARLRMAPMERVAVMGFLLWSMTVSLGQFKDIDRALPFAILRINQTSCLIFKKLIG
jgi:hypothetical protein